jgi:uncharacterized protein (TIGR03435 family)
MPFRPILLASLATLLYAQTESFDVASIRPRQIEGFIRRAWSANIECPPFHCGIAGTRFTDEAASLADLIMDAYRVRRYQIVGLPDWGDSGKDVYDLAAKVAGDQPPTLDQVRRMLQTLLADRFQLKFHREKRELPAYILTIARNGSKLKPCKPEDDGLTFYSSWERIPEMLGHFTERPVFDKTGFEGHYCTADGDEPFEALDMRGLATARPGRGGDPDSVVSIFSEVQQKWGMKLEPQKAPVDVLVIDHVSRPSAN